jgi:hypothetical protein
MTLSRPQEPQPACFSMSGIPALDRDSGCLPVHAVFEGPFCPWPGARESTSTKVSIGPDAAPWDMVDEWGVQSFPASDPPANW